MDRLIYIAGVGAQQLLQQQANTAHNLANASTTGFKADTTAFRTAPVIGPGKPTRAYAVETTTGADLAPGAIQPTGRDLDVAIEGDGFLTVQARDGTEAYTRNGSFQLSPDGELQTRTGLTVLGDGGPIVVPQDSKVSIGRDGTVSVITYGQSAANVTAVGQLKLVKIAPGDAVKGGDGLFRARNGQPADADPGVAITAGALEASNVNTVAAMVEMISLARQFELTMKVLQSADGNEQRATSLLGLNGQ
jgi:flagellar basal-body rod protein FlgF